MHVQHVQLHVFADLQPVGFIIVVFFLHFALQIPIIAYLFQAFLRLGRMNAVFGIIYVNGAVHVIEFYGAAACTAAAAAAARGCRKAGERARHRVNACGGHCIIRIRIRSSRISCRGRHLCRLVRFNRLLRHNLLLHFNLGVVFNGLIHVRLQDHFKGDAVPNAVQNALLNHYLYFSRVLLR